MAELSFIPTRGSTNQTLQNDQFQTAVYTRRKSGNERNKKPAKKKDPSNKDRKPYIRLNVQNEMEDIIKFGIKGYGAKKREKLEIARAQLRGSKQKIPKKRSQGAMNYKLLQEVRLKEKKAAAEEKAAILDGKVTWTPKSNIKEKLAKAKCLQDKKNSIIQFYGKKGNKNRKRNK